MFTTGGRAAGAPGAPWAAVMALGLLSFPAEAGAKMITVPDVLTVTVTGTVTTTGATGYDGLGLFGGGTLAGDSFTEVFTIADTQPVWERSFSATGLGSADVTAVTTINGHAYTLSGSGQAQDFYFPPNSGTAAAFDSRTVDVANGPPGDEYASDSVNRFPAQWGADPAGEAIFQNNTLSSQPGEFERGGSGFAVFPVNVNYGKRSTYTVLYFDVASISDAYTTTLAFIPEPSLWATLTLGLFAAGGALRR